ncbi:FCD domain-containing protein, partial [Streptomyces sp. NPDC059082]|uniref:FCD domain-containing protein n=1 Tax=Streptomyces sp. NPDC059082 TaxID=3346720 RepID=UPI00368F5869
GAPPHPPPPHTPPTRRARAGVPPPPPGGAPPHFHETVTELADNALLTELNATLRSRMRWMLGQHDDFTVVAEEHAELYRGIEARDVERVEALALRHLETSRDEAAAHQRRTAPE